jgi:hypothetical protein
LAPSSGRERFSVNTGRVRGLTTGCPGALTLYLDIKGEFTAKNIDAGTFDAILQIY